MPDVSSIAPTEVKQWIVFDVHKNSLVAAVLPAVGGKRRRAAGSRRESGSMKASSGEVDSGVTTGRAERGPRRRNWSNADAAGTLEPVREARMSAA